MVKVPGLFFSSNVKEKEFLCGEENWVVHSLWVLFFPLTVYGLWLMKSVFNKAPNWTDKYLGISSKKDGEKKGSLHKSFIGFPTWAEQSSSAALSKLPVAETMGMSSMGWCYWWIDWNTPKKTKGVSLCPLQCSGEYLPHILLLPEAASPHWDGKRIRTFHSSGYWENAWKYEYNMPGRI